MENQLFENEEILFNTTNRKLTLTSRRIRHTRSSFGKKHITSIHLEKISSIEIRYKSRPLILIMGIFMTVASGLSLSHTGEFITAAGGFLGLLMILLYFLLQYRSILISSDGGAKINIYAIGMNRDATLDFVNRIEKAKNLIK